MHRARPLFDAKRVFEEAMARWALGGAKLEVLSDSLNLVCAVDTELGRRVLRLVHSDHRSAAQVESELRFVDYLRRNELLVAAPLPSTEGRLAEHIDDHSGYFTASLLTWAPGSRVTYRSTLWSDQLVADWGRTMGRIHYLSRAYDTGDLRMRFAWDEADPLANALGYLPPTETKARVQFGAALDDVAALPRSPAEYGLIQGSFDGANFRADDKGITILDFDDCCYHWYVYDITVALWSYRHLRPKERERHLHTWLQGYATECSIDGHWLDNLSPFFRLRALYLLSRSYKLWDDQQIGDRERRARTGWRRIIDEGFRW